MIVWFRKLINPPYSVIDIFTLLGLLLILLTIPAISLSVTSVREPVSKAAVAPPCKSYGDTDLDGDVDMVDALFISRHLAGITTAHTPFNPQQLSNADVDGDKRVTMVDFLNITKFIAGLDVTFYSCADPDGDRFSNATEKYLGTDPYDSCPDNSGADAWPPDLYRTGTGAGKVNIQDITSFSAPVRRLDTKEGDANFNPRWDINHDGRISHSNTDLANSDIEAMRPFFNSSCSNGTSRPTLNLSVNNSSSVTVNRGEQVTLRWNTTNAGAPCEASGNWGGLKDTSGQASFSASEPGSFTLLCAGSNGKVEKSVSVNVRPCTGSLTYTIDGQPNGAVNVNPGGSVTSAGSGLTNCTSNDKLYLQYWDFDSSNPQWVSLGLSCALSSSGSCSIVWTPSDKLPLGSWPTRVVLNNSGNGTGNSNYSHDWVNVNIQEGPKCGGTLDLSVSDAVANGDVNVTASGLSNCNSTHWVSFWLNLNQQWNHQVVCNLSNGSSCSTKFTAPSSPGTYWVAALFTPPGEGTQQVNRQFIVTASSGGPPVNNVLGVEIPIRDGNVNVIDSSPASSTSRESYDLVVNKSKENGWNSAMVITVWQMESGFSTAKDGDLTPWSLGCMDGASRGISAQLTCFFNTQNDKVNFTDFVRWHCGPNQPVVCGNNPVTVGNYFYGYNRYVPRGNYGESTGSLNDPWETWYRQAHGL